MAQVRAARFRRGRHGQARSRGRIPGPRVGVARRGRLSHRLEVPLRRRRHRHCRRARGRDALRAHPVLGGRCHRGRPFRRRRRSLRGHVRQGQAHHREGRAPSRGQGRVRLGRARGQHQHCRVRGRGRVRARGGPLERFRRAVRRIACGRRLQGHPKRQSGRQQGCAHPPSAARRGPLPDAGGDRVQVRRGIHSQAGRSPQAGHRRPLRCSRRGNARGAGYLGLVRAARRVLLRQLHVVFGAGDALRGPRWLQARAQCEAPPARAEVPGQPAQRADPRREGLARHERARGLVGGRLARACAAALPLDGASRQRGGRHARPAGVLASPRVDHQGDAQLLLNRAVAPQRRRLRD
mmetsp:Transcript_6769/g.27647  ORF Transcript_6769/g.27647 Transcript_6769/m.27647 type:complete len:352 (-) Transcript_6769:362-1417(-)